ncbi:hypothetical protein pb186bvf_017285 [Paramecium bursaria]
MLSQDEFEFIKQQNIWTACPQTPFLIKAGIRGDSCLLFITNIKSSWTCKWNRQEIIDYFNLFNGAIKTNSFDAILDLLSNALNYNPEGSYNFQMNDTLLYGYNQKVKMYSLAWVFECHRLADEIHFKFITFDILKPTYQTISSLERQVQHQKFTIRGLEQDLQKRMTEKERQQYMPKNDDPQQYFNNQRLDQNQFCQIQMDPNTIQHMQFYTSLNNQSKQKQQRAEYPQLDQNINKKVQIQNAYMDTVMDALGQDEQQEEEQDIRQKKPKPNKKVKKSFI